MQLFVTDKGFLYVIPMPSKADVHKAIKAFIKTVGAPDAIICDAAREQTSKHIKALCNEVGTSLRILEKNTPWANRAELYIGLLKEAVRKDLKQSNSPLAFWDYCAERRARIHNLTANPLFQLQGQTPHQTIYGNEGDISNLCQFHWYEWIYFRDGAAGFPLPREVLGRSLGPATGEGNEMAQWVLKANGQVIPRRTVRPLTHDEHASTTEQDKRLAFDKAIAMKYPSIHQPDLAEPEIAVPEPYEDDYEQALTIPEFDDPIDATGQPFNQQPAYDYLIHAAKRW